MNLDTFDEHPPYRLIPSQDLYRIQLARSRPGHRPIGQLRVAPAGARSGRFCQPDQRVAYFADSPETAGYEAFGRREQEWLSLDFLRRREVVRAQPGKELSLLDLTLHAAEWPVLQATRFAETQALSVQAAAAGYDGLAYHSAQRHGGICFALFEPVLPGIRTRSRQRLIEAETGNLHRLVVTVARGAGLPLV